MRGSGCVGAGACTGAFLGRREGRRKSVERSVAALGEEPFAVIGEVGLKTPPGTRQFVTRSSYDMGGTTQGEGYAWGVLMTMVAITIKNTMNDDIYYFSGDADVVCVFYM